MRTKTTTSTFYVLRIYYPGGEVFYAYDSNRGYRLRASWCGTSKPESAYRFGNRSEARRILKSVWFKDFLKKYTNWFWEVVKITETTTTSFEEEMVTTDAPAMVAIARAAL
jgi:hypothetical protein